MILLVDTHALLWWLADDSRLTEPARRSIGDAANEVLASAASLWELEAKRIAGRLEAPDNILEVLEAMEISAIPVTPAEAVDAARLPLHHKDPIDRMLVAQARRLDAVIVTRDRSIARYEVNVLTA